MRRIVTGRQMKAADAYTMEQVGIPSLVLMERAALKVAERAKAGLGKKEPIWAVCGMGNNGADGAAAARMLFLEGFLAAAVLVGDEGRATPEMVRQLAIAKKLGMEVLSWEEAKERVLRGGTVIDGLFGVGLGRPVEGVYRECIEAVNQAREQGRVRRVVAVDVPSGIHSGTGAVMGAAIRADETVTFGWEKCGMLLYPGRSFAGRVWTEDIGFPAQALKETEEEVFLTYGREDLERLPPRPAHSNKGTFGRLLIVAGSRNMCGAAYLSALGAYRAGAGLVRVLTVEENRPVLLQLLPEAILSTYTADQLTEGREEFQQMIAAQCQWADAVVLGPGLGSEEYVEYLVEDILTNACTPVVVDADGLNAIAARPYLTSYFTENIIITPHLGEMARLTGQAIKEIAQDLPACAGDYASRYGITCVLKDAATVVASRDGEIYINSSGTSAMAKAGSGDVLTGILGALLAQGMEERESARLGVYLHGLAGELAKAQAGSRGVLARDLADCVALAMKEGEKGSQER